MGNNSLASALAFLCVVGSSSTVSAADPWADHVVSFDSGSNPTPGYINANAALGEPTHQSIAFGGYPVTPFSGAADVSELVSLGEGGELVVRFDEPVVDHPANPFGIDLMVFGNSFFFLNSFNNDETDTASGPTASEGGVVSVSADGVNYFVVPGVEADGRFPTLGFSDITIPFPASAAVPTDFTKPVDPSFNVTDLNTAAIVAGYNGSGGGLGIDLAAVGLAQISYVKITNPVGSGVTPEIDGLADVRAVPEPHSALLALISLIGVWLIRLRAQ